MEPGSAAWMVTEVQAAVVLAQALLDDALKRRRKAVRQLRAEGWSLQRIADHIGVTKTAIANICG